MALGRRRLTEDPQIDLTPMLDVVFIMLIFFIVTASFIKESGIEVNRPPISDEPPPDDKKIQNIIFQITETNDVWLEGRLIDIRSVRANVERAHAENPRAKVIIEAHPRSKTETFILVSDQAREAGVYDVALASKG